MKSTLQRALLSLTVAVIGAGAVNSGSAQTPAAATPPAFTGHHGHFRPDYRGGRFVGSLLRATRQLNLSAQQQSDIKTILSNARHGHQPGTQPPLTVLGNPSDPGFAAAVQGAASAASNRIQNESVVAGQIYAVLNTTQRQELPTVLASIQSKEQARRAAWAARHAAGSG